MGMKGIFSAVTTTGRSEVCQTIGEVIQSFCREDRHGSRSLKVVSRNARKNLALG